jgi:hypothetical protein
MKAKKWWIIVWCMACLAFSATHGWAGIDTLRSEAAGALKQAMAKLKNPTDTDNIVCLTNAGYALVRGEGT